VSKFPVIGGYVVVEDALAKQTISQGGYIEITAKGNYLFTETEITAEQGNRCAQQ
jgi:hypothetical protein